MKINLADNQKIDFFSGKKKIGAIIFGEKGIRLEGCYIAFLGSPIPLSDKEKLETILCYSKDSFKTAKNGGKKGVNK